MTDNVNAAIEFITTYRRMEKQSYAEGFDTIGKCVKAHQRTHLCGSWQGRKRDFGSFFLNLSCASQGAFIEHWGIKIEGYREYCQSVSDHPGAAFFLDPPPMIHWLRELMKFFNNHSVTDECAPGIRLNPQPPKRDQFGNSANWGKYILKLKRIDAVKLLESLEARVFEGNMNTT